MSYSYTDPSQNFMGRHPSPLDALFHPETIALIGAKDDKGSVGHTLINNLLTGGWKGRLYPINPKRSEVSGLRCYPSLDELPEPVDLAILITPAKTIPALIQACVDHKVKGCIVISAGFKELGASGALLEQEVVRIAQAGHMPLLGPNCLGLMNPHIGLNATFARGMALAGNIAFLSQSGAMCTAVLDWSVQEQIGFSAFISVGSMGDIDFGDWIDYLSADPHTHSILMYMETVGDARRFLSAARQIALEKPLIIIKAGKTAQAAQAAASHTGSLAGSDAVFNAALERVGALRVDSIAELFQMASVLGRQPRPQGPHLTIVTNAGGPGVLATDACIASGAQLTSLSATTLQRLNASLPPAWSRANPVDILGDADPERFAETLEILMADEASEGILVVLSPQDMTDPTRTAEALLPYAITKKPLLTSWMGGAWVGKGREILNQASIPSFDYPDDAAATFGKMWQYSKNLASLYQTPRRLQVSCTQDKRKRARHFLATVPTTLLDEATSKKMIEAYGIPVVKTVIAHTAQEAVVEAKAIGFPSVLKLYSPTITHKSDVGGVKLHLRDEEAVKKAFEEIRLAVSPADFMGVTVQPMVEKRGYELILGSSVDPQFGPILLFGLGGKLVELFQDTALALPPLNATLATFWMQKTKIYQALQGIRGERAVNVEQLEAIVVAFSQFIAENPRIQECDINPLLVTAEQMVALDARMVLAPLGQSVVPLAIRPYPVQFVKEVSLKNGERLSLRPILPEDEPLMVDFHKRLSHDTVRQRFFSFIDLDARIAHERLVRICYNDFDREMALVAQNPTGAVVAVVRLSRLPGSLDSQLTLVIEDTYQRMGLGTKLMEAAMHMATQEGIQKVIALILDENRGMLTLCSRFGFIITPTEDPHIMRAEKGVTPKNG